MDRNSTGPMCQWFMSAVMSPVAAADSAAREQMPRRLEIIAHAIPNGECLPVSAIINICAKYRQIVTRRDDSAFKLANYACKKFIHLISRTDSESSLFVMADDAHIAGEAMSEF